MRLLLPQIVLPLDYGDADVRRAAAGRLRVSPETLRDVVVRRRSVDARKERGSLSFVLAVEVELADADAARVPSTVATSVSPEPTPAIIRAKRKGPRPVVIGAGPAGLFAALALAEAGAEPILCERGAPAEERSRDVARFWSHGDLNPESNVLFGEGGAGLFSDGKLTSRSKDERRHRRVLETFVSAGASPDILIDAEPHLGSDVLAQLVPTLRERIVRAGGEVRFHAALTDLHVEQDALTGVTVAGQTLVTDACVLAVGHSARDVYARLAARGVPLEAKAFAVGARVEISQEKVDAAQWGRAAGHPRLGAASFRLTRKPEADARACYSFCMCPGGSVIACASSPGEALVNGMSLSRRAGPFANAAFLVPVTPEDFPANAEDSAILAGLEFQRRIERAVFAAGGGDYSIPASPLTEFLAGETPKGLPERRSLLRARPVDLRSLWPEFVTRTLARAVPKMLRTLRGVRPEEAILYAAETRTSSPVRIPRREDGRSTTVAGLYPAGEGAGYAGGIVSAAIDGLRAAEAILSRA